MSKDYRWYVDPCGDPYSNEVVAVRLSTIGEVKEEHLYDENGELRGVYEIERHIMNELRTAKKRDRNLRFKFFVRRGKSKLREWTFEDRKRDSAKVKEVKKRIAGLKK